MKPLFLIAALFSASSAFAQVTIDQNKALAGNVTPGDTPGFPITISQPGSYKLAGHLTVPAGSKGIVITANNVTLDLNGYTLAGPSACTRMPATKVVTCTYGNDNTSIGIDAGTTTGAVVRNGTVKGFAASGIVAGDLGRYEELRVTESYNGVVDGASQAYGNTFSHVVVDTNYLWGMSLNAGVITASRAINNGHGGFGGGGALTVSESQAIGNKVYGLDGVSVRGSVTAVNGVNRTGIKSMGGNLDSGALF